MLPLRASRNSSTVVQGAGDQFKGDYQKLFDDGIQIALKHLGE
jgi:hypothetical protein